MAAAVYSSEIQDTVVIIQCYPHHYAVYPESVFGLPV